MQCRQGNPVRCAVGVDTVLHDDRRRFGRVELLPQGHLTGSCIKTFQVGGNVVEIKRDQHRADDRALAVANAGRKQQQRPVGDRDDFCCCRLTALRAFKHFLRSKPE